VISRTDYYIPAVTMAFVRFNFPEMYELPEDAAADVTTQLFGEYHPEYEEHSWEGVEEENARCSAPSQVSTTQNKC